MLIAHITDSHIELPEPIGAGRVADFERVIGDINRLYPQPDLVIHTGDISHCNDSDEYVFARTQLKRLNMPFHVIPGNKDRRDMVSDIFGLPSGFNQQVVDTPDWQVILLDTLSDTSNMGAFCAKRRDWLSAALSACQKPVVIFMHHPSFEMADNPYPFQFVERQEADAFTELVTGYDNIKGIFCGHAHRNTTGCVGTIPAMTLTAMSQDRRKGQYPLAMNNKPVYQLIDLADNGSFACQLKVCV